MCKFFSFAVTREGKVLTLLGEDRKKVSEESADSHSAIAEVFGISEDETWKFELPFNRETVTRLKKGESLRDIFSELRDYYDGGLNIKEFDEEMERKVFRKLSRMKKKIIETGEELFKLPLIEQIIGNLEPAQFVIELSKARAPQELFNEITGNLSPAGRRRTGFIFDHKGKYDYSLLNCFDFEEFGNISKIFVHRFVHEFATINEQGEPIKQTELRVYVYPIAYTLKEGEEA